MSARENDLLKEIRDFYELCISADGHNRSQAIGDLQFLTGDQWPDQLKRQRQLEQRPCLTFNRLPTYLNQVTNDQRQNTPSIKVHAVGNGADEDKAEIIQGIVRHIEYSTNADTAYDTAVNSAAAVGFGYWRLITDYESPTSFDQVIKYERIRNPLTVFFDPASKEADGSDGKQCLIATDVEREQFKRQYPKAEADTYNALINSGLQVGWMSDKFVRVVEYYYFDYVKKTLCQMNDGSVRFFDELQEHEKLQVKLNADGKMQKRESQIPQLKWCKATGAAIIEETDIMCQWIPVFPVWGTEVDIQGKVYRSGIIRDAKDPAQMYNYWMTCATEEISMRPKIPYIGAEGQFEDHEDQWGQANNVSFSYLEYKPVTIDGNLAPAPARQPMADVPTGMLQMAIHASDNIKAVTGLFDANLGARSNETSGKAIVARQREGDTGTFHYTDNLNRAIRHCGRCLVDMFPHYYDGERTLRMLQEDNTAEAVDINKPQINPLNNEVATVLNDMTVGTYDVTISTGPSYSTLRQEAAESMVQMSQSWPKLMDIAGDKVVAAMDWPGHEEIAERIKKTIPANITDDGEQQPQIPPQVQQQLQQMEQLIHQQEQALQEADSHIDRIKIETNSRERIAEMNNQAALDVAYINKQAKTDAEEIKGMVQQLMMLMTPSDPTDSPSTEESQTSEPAQPGLTDATSGT